jgi:hypothetical protein
VYLNLQDLQKDNSHPINSATSNDGMDEKDSRQPISIIET